MRLSACTPCLKCGYVPESPEDQATTILLSDHNMKNEALEEIAGARLNETTPTPGDRDAHYQPLVWQVHTIESESARPDQTAPGKLAGTISLGPGCCPARWSRSHLPRVVVRPAEALPQ